MNQNGERCFYPPQPLGAEAKSPYLHITLWMQIALDRNPLSLWTYWYGCCNLTWFDLVVCIIHYYDIESIANFQNNDVLCLRSTYQNLTFAVLVEHIQNTYLTKNYCVKIVLKLSCVRIRFQNVSLWSYGAYRLIFGDVQGKDCVV